MRRWATSRWRRAVSDFARSLKSFRIRATPADGPQSWLRAGRVLSYVLLSAAASGITAAYLNQPIEVDALRPRLRDAAGMSGFPQILMRMGFGPKAGPTVRRPVDEVITAAARA